MVGCTNVGHCQERKPCCFFLLQLEYYQDCQGGSCEVLPMEVPMLVLMLACWVSVWADDRMVSDRHAVYWNSSNSRYEFTCLEFENILLVWIFFSTLNGAEVPFWRLGEFKQVNFIFLTALQQLSTSGPKASTPPQATHLCFPVKFQTAALSNI